MQKFFMLTIFAIYGAVIGSFLNVVIYRLEKGISVAKGRSFCPSCGHTLSWIDLVPVLSYIFLKGKCRYCHDKISPRYPLIELLTAVLFALSAVFSPNLQMAVANSLLACVLVPLAFIDIDTGEIPDRFHVMIAALALVPIAMGQITLTNALIGAVIISLPMLGIAMVMDGFGGGDVKLMAAAGLFLGVKGVIFALFAGIITGGIFAVTLLIKKKVGGKSQMPFGQFLSLGIFIAALWGEKLVNLYLTWVGF